MKKILLLFLITCDTFTIKAQVGKEAWHWQFGTNAALDFSSGSPVIGTSNINTHEGCASISDRNTGQLLFYTDGDSVWDKNNIRMPNGIGLINGIQGTTTQGATIVPRPGTNNIYYIITAYDEAQPNYGVYYSIVDMNLNGGLGDVTTKNVLLTAPLVTEKVVATRHCNGTDYWILTHPFNSNNFNAYLVNSLGIDSTPVVSSIGAIEQNICCGGFEATGYLKVSPNGKKLALCLYIFSPKPIIEIYDFDNSTGIVSNLITIQINGGNYNGAYGCSFSPDNTKLYATVSGGSINRLLQFDLSSGVQSTILASCDSLFTSNNHWAGGLQIAPNGKIYVANQNSDSIGVINSPNSLGTACNYQYNAFRLSNNTISGWGFPNFIDAGLSPTYTCTSTNINEALLTNRSVTIYPNPTIDQFFIEANTTDKLSVDLYDVNGRHVFSSNVRDKSNINVATLDNGIYTMTIKSVHLVANKKLVIVR